MIVLRKLNVPTLWNALYFAVYVAEKTDYTGFCFTCANRQLLYDPNGDGSGDADTK